MILSVPLLYIMVNFLQSVSLNVVMVGYQLPVKLFDKMFWLFTFLNFVIVCSCLYTLLNSTTVC